MITPRPGDPPRRYAPVAPSVRPVTTLPEDLPPVRRFDSRQVRDLCALLLIVVGLIGLLIVSFAAHPLAGWGALSVLVGAVGVLLGFGR